MGMINKAWRTIALAGVSAATLSIAAPAAATPTVPTSDGLCASSETIPVPNAIDCAGYYTGNILNGSPTDVTAQQNALASLGFTWDGNWNNLVTSGLVTTTLTNGNELDFGQTLFGTVIIGSHWGEGNPTIGNSSVFWEFNFTTPTNFITLSTTQGFSNAALYEDGPHVPEPATWAMMVLGFGVAGFAVRRRRKVLVSQLA